MTIPEAPRAAETTEDDAAELSARERAAETKKRRTRQKLINAAAYAIEQDGMNFKPEDVAEDAGVSIATYYNFFKSKGDVFRNVFFETIVEPLENKPILQAKLAKENFGEDTTRRYGLSVAGLGMWLANFESLTTGKAELVKGMLIDWLEDVEREARDLNCIVHLGVQVWLALDLPEDDAQAGLWCMQFVINLCNWAVIYADMPAPRRNINDFTRFIKFPDVVHEQWEEMMTKAGAKVAGSGAKLDDVTLLGMMPRSEDA